jgi:hypothetical protein
MYKHIDDEALSTSCVLAGRPGGEIQHVGQGGGGGGRRLALLPGSIDEPVSK